MGYIANAFLDGFLFDIDDKKRSPDPLISESRGGAGALGLEGLADELEPLDVCELAADEGDAWGLALLHDDPRERVGLEEDGENVTCASHLVELLRPHRVDEGELDAEVGERLLEGLLGLGRKVLDLNADEKYYA